MEGDPECQRRIWAGQYLDRSLGRHWADTQLSHIQKNCWLGNYKIIKYVVFEVTNSLVNFFTPMENNSHCNYLSNIFTEHNRNNCYQGVWGVWVLGWAYFCLSSPIRKSSAFVMFFSIGALAVIICIFKLNAQACWNIRLTIIYHQTYFKHTKKFCQSYSEYIPNTNFFLKLITA